MQKYLTCIVLGDDDEDSDDDDDDEDDDEYDEVLDLLGWPHVPCFDWFSRTASLFLFLLFDRHRDRWQAPSIARLQRN